MGDPKLKVVMGAFNLNRLSVDKPILMGVATAFIICCHAPYWCNDLPVFLSKTLMMGYIGVDIFLLISGIGMFYSWASTYNCNSKYKLLKWYLRRYKRLLIPYLVISVPIYAALCYLDGDNWYSILENVSTISYWTRHLGAWYVAMLLPLYILTPLLVKCLSGKYRWYSFSILVISCYIIAVIQIDHSTNNIISNLCFIIRRLPSFLLGISIGSYVKECRSISANFMTIIAAVSLVATVVLYKFHLPFEMFLSILIVLLICLTLNIDIPIVKFLNKLNIALCKISLESYLLNIFLPLLLIRIDWDKLYPGFNKGNYSMYLLTICLGVLLSYLVRMIYTHNGYDNNRKKISSQNISKK